MKKQFIDNLSIDCVVFGFEHGKLNVLLVKRNIEPAKGLLSLPCGFVGLNEDLDVAPALRLKELTGIENLFLRQFYAFGDLHRYHPQRVITIAYFALVKISDYKLNVVEDAMECCWISVNNLPELPFDQFTILQVGLNTLRERVKMEPIVFNLLPEKFTISELQNVYEAILEKKFDKRNFRKKMVKMNILIDTNLKQKNVSHRAANLYKFDAKNYQKLLNRGFRFDL